MRTDAATLIEQLRSTGIIATDAEPLPPTTPDTPWFIAVLLGGAGWLAGLFLLLLLGVLAQPDSALGFGVLAVLLLVPGMLGFRFGGDTVFVPQLALVLCVAGQISAITAFAFGTEDAAAVALLSTLMLAGLVPLLANPAAQSLNTVAACAAWALAVHFMLIGEPWDRLDMSQIPLGLAVPAWGLAWLPPLLLLFVLQKNEVQWLGGRSSSMWRAVIVGIIIALAFATPLSQPWLGFGATESTGERNWLALWPLLSIAAALCGAATAFVLRHRMLLALALLGALLHVGHFYFALGVELLAKSLLMLVLGAALLVGAHWLQRGGGR